ncbi:hypothetical protein [Nocardia sp. XZ_19_369]|uniref:hypothetical protein n=1 Tax=Nocardia sp. XZ_19_369 TaxID=2769487 RepID=UPI00188EB5E5|nr:hypothetical protein [Nocardia sp. XZ_19_369]
MAAPGTTGPPKANSAATSTPPGEGTLAAAPPANNPPPQGNGTIIITTVTTSGNRVPRVPVYIRQMVPCDPTIPGIPQHAREASVRESTTDYAGEAVFTAPVGCYIVGMTAPPGTSPATGEWPSLSIAREGQVANAELRFYDSAPDPCSAETIARDLAKQGGIPTGMPSVRECDGNWAVISWDSPGDTQRIVYSVPDRWSTYLVFPHDKCWAQAESEGVPARLKPYFSC